MSENYEKYVDESVTDDEDDGTMPENIAQLATHVVGHRIIKAEKRDQVFHPYLTQPDYTRTDTGLLLTLDNGTAVFLSETGDCCAYTEVDDIIEHLPGVDHIITGVESTGGYERWHILADLGEVLEIKVGWSAGNPFYYGYGFDINVIPAVLDVEGGR